MADTAPSTTQSAADRIEIVARDLKFPEGPVFDKEGHLYICEMQRRQITRLSPDGTAEKFVDTGGVPNGAILGTDRRLWVCDNTLKAVLAVSLDTKKIETICKDCDGQGFRGPNDLVMDKAGNVYFTDPVGSGKAKPVGCVYRWDAGTKKVRRIAEKLAFPNGIVLSDDEKTLYIAETEARCVWAYPLAADGGLGERKLAGALEEGHGPDGIALDSRGRLLAAWFGGKCVAVFDPAGDGSRGNLVRKVAIPDENPTNLEFGGTRHSDLYITGSKAGVVLKLAWECPGQKMAGD